MQQVKIKKTSLKFDQSLISLFRLLDLMEDYSLPEDSLFLGFDCSTQSLKATVLDAKLKIFVTEVVIFDNDLPHYKTKDGVYRDQLVDGRIVSPTLMWVEALDLILQKLKNSKLDFGKIVAVSGSAQQHGSVYWKDGSSILLSSLDSKKPLVEQLGDAFSIKDSPIWMDCSTTEQCRAIEKAVGGALELSKLTGSCAHERYVGPQIRKIFEKEPDVYKVTERISLVSSFMASLLTGGYASIDHTDGAGMNLMDIKSRDWSKTALQATAPDLEKKLGKLAPAFAVAGFLSRYYVERYQFTKNCLVVQWSGDNPNSLAGLTLNTPGDLAISLGTSDTVFGIATDHKPGLEGHTFPSPVDMKDYMVMLVYKNGSLTREDIRNRHANKSWNVFNTYLMQRPPLNGGRIGFYYKEHEILPPLPIGEHRYILDNFENGHVDGQTGNGVMDGRTGTGVIKENGIIAENGVTIENEFMKEKSLIKENGVTVENEVMKEKSHIKENGVTKDNDVMKEKCVIKEHRNMENGIIEFDAPSEVRALIEGQLLSMRAHVERIGMPCPPRRIFATGGASANTCILDMIASIFGCDVYTVERPDSASLGAALRAAHGWLCHKQGSFVPIKCMYNDILDKSSLCCKLSAPAGDKQLYNKYTSLMKRRAEIENELVQKLGRI